MSFLKLVQKRRSCRRYSSQTVPQECLDRCLEAARLAPSACNSQPWRFIVVTHPALKAELAQKAFSKIYSMNTFAAQAPVLIVLVRERSKYMAQLGGFVRGVQYSLIDLGIVGEHFILQAAEEGLGTCWIGWFNERAVKKTLGLSRQDKVDIIISVGYPEEIETYDKKRKDLTEFREFR